MTARSQRRHVLDLAASVTVRTWTLDPSVNFLISGNSEAGVTGFVRGHLGYRFASTKQVAEMTEAFVESIMQFGLNHQIDLVRFKKGQRKDDVMQPRPRAFKKKLQEGVVFIAVAQEKARVPRTVRKARLLATAAPFLGSITAAPM